MGTKACYLPTGYKMVTKVSFGNRRPKPPPLLSKLVLCLSKQTADGRLHKEVYLQAAPRGQPVSSYSYSLAPLLNTLDHQADSPSSHTQRRYRANAMGIHPFPTISSASLHHVSGSRPETLGRVRATRTTQVTLWKEALPEAPQLFSGGNHPRLYRLFASLDQLMQALALPSIEERRLRSLGEAIQRVCEGEGFCLGRWGEGDGRLGAVSSAPEVKATQLRPVGEGGPLPARGHCWPIGSLPPGVTENNLAQSQFESGKTGENPVAPGHGCRNFNPQKAQLSWRGTAAYEEGHEVA